MSANERISLEHAKQLLHGALGPPEDKKTPFPWQEELLARFASGKLERSLDIPTGLGKTAVMAIWLLARACGAALPRRLVYVVDRRAVVDQATDVAKWLRDWVDRSTALKCALGLENRSLPISTLRGQYVDNKEWLEDPASPAIIVGTVDMIGSRLLFEGYGTSRKMRPYHAGLLGADAIVVLDEAHLVPPFEKLLETIAEGCAVFGPRDEALRALVPPFRLLSLSATGRAHAGTAFGLQDADLEHPDVRQRLNAPKRLIKHPCDDPAALAEVLAEQAWKLAHDGKRAVRCIVFCDQREVAKNALKALEKRAKGDKKAGIAEVAIEVELFVGGRRVREREDAAKRLRELGFIAGFQVERQKPVFVFATSAGEVGVDLDADHMVSDLVAWERMVQRLGRVNRRGNGEADVIVVVTPEPKPKKGVQDALAKDPAERSEKESKAIAAHEASAKQATAQAQPLGYLPFHNGVPDASPGALRALKARAQNDPELQAVLDAATTPAPLRPALSRALIDAWSMTSLKEHTGRPEIAPWLRGWVADDQPQTAVVWRTHLPVRLNEDPSPEEIASFFEAAPPHTSEILETETSRVVEWLTARAKKIAASLAPSRATPAEAEDGNVVDNRPLLHENDVGAIVLTPAGDFSGKKWRLQDLLLDGNTDTKKQKDELERALRGATLVVDARMGGLTKAGLLDAAEDGPPRTVDDDDDAAWISETAGDAGQAASTTAPVVRFRVRTAEAGQTEINEQWRERFRFSVRKSEDGETTQWLIVDKWRHDAATEEDRSAAGRPQPLDEHQECTEGKALFLAQRLGLPVLYARMLAIAARLHDEGKRAKRWQQAFNARTDNIYAKTRGPVNIKLLDGYRHELGSLPYAVKNEHLRELPEDLQDLALHLIAAHHGFARPVIGTSGCEDAPPSALEERARDVALRFARLQKRWGPWGLAWWEALLRAADQQASRDNDAGEPAAKESI